MKGIAPHQSLKNLSPVRGSGQQPCRPPALPPVDSRQPSFSPRPLWALGALALSTLAGCASLQAPPVVATSAGVVPVPTSPQVPAAPLKATPEAPDEVPDPAPPPGPLELPPEESCSVNLCEKILRYDPHVEAAAERYDLDPNLIRGVIAQESRGNPKVTSPKGAKGLMQLMPGTARDLGVKNRVDPRQNILGGSRYLDQLLEQNDGDVEKALWAYNAGPGNLEKGVKPAETRHYIKAVLEYARQFREYLQGKSPQPPQPLSLSTPDAQP